MKQKITLLLVDDHPLLVVILLAAFLMQGCAGVPPTPGGSSDLQPTNSSGVFTLLFYKPLVMEYDPEKWSDKSEYENTAQIVNYLESRTLKTCRVGPVGPSGFFPDTTEPVQLGGVRYTTTILSDPAAGLVIGYYFEDHSLERFDYEMGIAVITIQAHPDEWDACKTSGEDVLSTLHAPKTVSEYSYVWISQEERISQTDLIVEGVVTGISATVWNSDNGEAWKPNFPSNEADMNTVVPVPLQIHTISVEVAQVIKDQVGVGKNITITVLGNSPLDREEWADHHLRVGERVVLLLDEGEIAWKSGLLKVIRLIGVPSHSYYKQAEDGRYYNEIDFMPMELDALIDFIHEDILNNTIPNSSFESVTINGITVHAGNYRIETDMLTVDVCYDMPDASDWLPEKVSFVDTKGQKVSPQYLSVIEIRYPPQLVDGKMQQLVTDGNRDRYQDSVPGQKIGQRCDTLLAVLPEGFDTSSFIITINSIARNPSEPDVCGPLDGSDSEYLKKIQSALDEQKTGIKIKHEWERGEEGGTCGLEIIQKPDKMTESEARLIIHNEDMFTDLFGVRGPWVFKGSLK